ncbi:MAG: hypothetical protein V2A34_12725 [Lentisphaerota bacterium]
MTDPSGSRASRSSASPWSTRHRRRSLILSVIFIVIVMLGLERFSSLLQTGDAVVYIPAVTSCRVDMSSPILQTDQKSLGNGRLQTYHMRETTNHHHNTP